MPFITFANHNFCTWRDVTRIDDSEKTALRTAAHLRIRMLVTQKGTACRAPTMTVHPTD